MTREEFVQRMVIEQLGSLLSTDDPGYVTPEKLIARANEFADALYGSARQVEGDDVLALREAFVDVYRWLLACKEDPSRAKCGFVIDTLDGYRPLYNECQKALGEEDDDAR